MVKFSNLKKFEDMLIIDCAKYVIDCFELMLAYYKYNLDDWVLVLTHLRNIDKCNYLDEWVYKLIEMSPDCINEFTHYNDDNEYLKEEEYYILKHLYKNVDDGIQKILEAVYLIISGQLYTITKKADTQTLVQINEILQFCHGKIELPY